MQISSVQQDNAVYCRISAVAKAMAGQARQTLIVDVGFEDMKKLGIIIIMAMLLLQSGCGTLVMRSAGLRDELYPATQGDIIMINGALDPDGTIFAQKSYILAGLTCIDVPISVAFDTVLLPFDLMRRHSYRKTHPKKENPTKN